MKAAFIAAVMFFMVCDAQVYRTYIPDSPISIIFLKRDREVRQTHHENGAVESECEYNDNRRDGVCKEFYENGILKSQIEFKNGREHGTALFYYDTGVLRLKIDYKRSKPQSITNYDERGKKL
jgi:antitoxin component YwqK of YwqJK toxin-antitoxin module